MMATMVLFKCELVFDIVDIVVAATSAVPVMSGFATITSKAASLSNWLIFRASRFSKVQSSKSKDHNFYSDSYSFTDQSTF